MGPFRENGSFIYRLLNRRDLAAVKKVYIFTSSFICWNSGAEEFIKLSMWPLADL